MHNSPVHSPGFSSFLPMLILAMLLLAYLYAVMRQRKTGRKWSGFRTFCFIIGTILAMIAVSPPLASEAHHNLSGHMVQHLLIGMLAPLGLVLAAPLSLALRVLHGSNGRIITSILRSRPFHYISHPVSALLLNIGGMYLLYLTPLYIAMERNMLIHYIVHFHFLAAGYLFIWSIAGPDPAPKRPPLRIRLIVLFISMATHAYLSKLMYAHHFPRNTMYSSSEIEDAALIMYYGGDLAEVLLAIAFFGIWYRARNCSTRMTGGLRQLKSESLRQAQ